MKKNTKILAALTLALVIGLTGCSGNKKTRSDDYDYEEEVYAETTAATEALYMSSAAVVNDSVSFAEDYSYDMEVAEYEEAYNEAYVDGDSDSDTVSANSDERMLIRTVSITCETVSYAAFTDSIEDLVNSAGGYIEYKDSYGTGKDGDLRSAVYTIRVPAESLDSLIGAVGDGAIVTYSSESTEDVTLSYADTQALLESLRTEQETLTELLSRAENIDTIIALQNELTNVRYRIESCESRLRILENQSEYSTLNLTINEVLEEKEPEEAHVKTFSEEISEAFEEGVENTRDFFKDLVLGIVSSVFVIIAIVVAVVIILVVVLVVRKKIRKKKNAAKAAEGEDPVDNQKDEASGTK